jgi:molybdopterin converting factor small subunit
MRIRIDYYGQSRQIAGKDSEFIEVPSGSSAGDAVLSLASMYGEKMQYLLLSEKGTPRRSVILAVNDVSVDPGAAECLNEHDVLAVLPAVGGG